ncbi:MAG: hypothetical protein COW08_08680 [Ignavibacteriales bacterium CG12_big_fil_rev_8_21_14_0_65_30_8]|nr:MAG: hypothetical protein COW08_08680 [Ignavibacteriales bacterium CG12_big_fil_rev_8_21_14_0_65_30_8]
MKVPNPVIAAIDIGTNSFHLLIAKINNKNKIQSIYKARNIMRLGTELGGKIKKISKNEIKLSIKILLKYKKIAEKYNAEIFAIGTSAIREVNNRNQYIKKVEKETGINIKVISGKKEAEYIYKGIEKVISIKNKKVLCIDIGGGSTEILYVKKGKTIFSTSIKVGAVRMTNSFFPDDNLNIRSIIECDKFVEKQIKNKRGINFNPDYEIVVGSSGTIHAAASMIYYNRFNKPLKKPNGYSFTRKEFDKMFEKVMDKRTPIERLGIKGLQTKRADIIPAGLIILSVIFDLFKIKRIILSENDLRAGIVSEATKTNR